MNIIEELTYKALTKAQSNIGLHIFRFRNGYHYVPDVYGKSAVKLRDIRQDNTFYGSALRVIDDKRTFLYYDRLYTLYQSLRNVAYHNPLVICEVGVYRGGSSYFLASTACKLSKSPIQMYCIDTFEGHDIEDLLDNRDGEHKIKDFCATSYQEVSEYLSKFEFLRVMKGRIQEVAPKLPWAREFSLVHLDVDLYEPYKYSLNFFSERMVHGGIIICDDYGFKTCPGAKEAIDEFMQGRNDFTFFELMTGQCIIIKRTHDSSCI